MSKCSLDIKIDIIDKVRNNLDGQGMFATSRQTLEITNIKEANDAIRKVNE